MKKQIITLAASALVVVATLSSCNSTEKKVDTARENVVLANKELDKALKDSIHNYKTQTEIIIADFEQQIIELKANISKEKLENRSAYEKNVEKLEQKNKELQKQLTEYNEMNQEKWQAFKKEFNKDLDELGSAFKNFVENK